MASNITTGEFEPVCGRPTLAVDSALVHRTKQLQTTKNKTNKTQTKKQSEQLVLKCRFATMPESYSRQIDTTTINRTINLIIIIKKRTNTRRQNRSAALGRTVMKLLGGIQLVCGPPTLAFCSALLSPTLSSSVCLEDY